jgi:hypothetical protein
MTLGSGSEWPGDVRFDPFATDLFELRRTPLRGGLMVAMRHCGRAYRGLARAWMSASRQKRTCAILANRPELT